MKRTALKRKASLRRGKPLARTGKLKPRNSSRSTAARAQDFGEEGKAVAAMPCLITGDAAEPAHIVSRGASGGRFDIIPLRPDLHREQHQIGIKSFAAKYGLDLRAEADRIALSHPEPLGLRGVARRWLELTMAIDDPAIHHDSGVFAERLYQAPDEYEQAALLGWVRREMERAQLEASPDAFSRSELASEIAMDLGFSKPTDSEFEDYEYDEETASALCELAGWPS
jgi:hypothetical protein